MMSPRQQTTEPQRHRANWALCVSVSLWFVSTILATSASAHHSLTVEFDITRMVTATGTISEMKWTNPHSWLTLEVKDDKGAVTMWQIEFASPNSLYRRGWRKSDLPPTARVTVVGYPSRDKSANVMTATDVTLPDGRTLFGGMPQTGN
jgi:hypothetical protein